MLSVWPGRAMFLQFSQETAIRGSSTPVIIIIYYYYYYHYYYYCYYHYHYYYYYYYQGSRLTFQKHWQYKFNIAIKTMRLERVFKPTNPKFVLWIYNNLQNNTKRMLLWMNWISRGWNLNNSLERRQHILITSLIYQELHCVRQSLFSSLVALLSPLSQATLQQPKLSDTALEKHH